LPGASLQVAETVAAFAAVVLLVVLLKRLGVIHAPDQAVFARLLTQVVIPAVVFYQLAIHPLDGRKFLLVLAMFLAGCASLFLAWLAGRLLRLDRPHTGALMITSAFGSSALLGYPLIQFAFPHNPEAMADAVLVSELGVGLPIFILCPLIAMHFGAARGESRGFSWGVLAGYLRSPIFLAVVIGLLASRCPVLAAPANAGLLRAPQMIEGSLTFLACLVLGLQLSFRSPAGLLPLVVVSAILQMGIQPALAHAQATLYGLGLEQRQVLTLISAMPSAVLGPVFASHYECAGETAASLVFVNILLSVLFVPLTFAALAH
jgi:hypothetical protein